MKKSKLIKLYFFVVLCFFIYFYIQKSHYNLVAQHELQQVRQKLKQLDPEEMKDLAYFFKYANVFDQYAYTLVGYKPMSICCYLQSSEDLPPILQADYQKTSHRDFADRLERGVQVWEQIKHLFEHEKFLIVSSHSSISKGMKTISILHKELCQKLISNQLDIFFSQLKKATSLKDVFEILSNPTHPQFYEIQENDLLLGILLGFGENNSRLFNNKQRSGLTGFSNEWPIWPRKWLLPGFLCDPKTDETKELKLKYNEARKYIRWTYLNRNGLEVTLALLSKNTKSDK